MTSYILLDELHIQVRVPRDPGAVNLAALRRHLASQSFRQAAATLGLALGDVRATLPDPVDLRGLPRLTDDGAVWCPPAFLPRDGQGVLFLDELAQAAPLVQAACLQLTLDRRVGEYELPAGGSVVAARNRAEDRARTPRLISPLLNPFLDPDLADFPDDWQGLCGGARSGAA